MYFACPGDRHLVFLGKFLKSKNGDNILKFFITLKNPLDAPGSIIVFLPYHIGVENPGIGGQGINSRIDTHLRDGTIQGNHRVQMTESGHNTWIGVVIRRYINRLKRGDRSFLGRSDPFLKLTHLCTKCWLISHGRRHPSQQCRDFHSGKDVSINIIDKEEHILSLFFAEIFGHRQSGKRNPQAHSRWLVHLAKDHHCLAKHTGFLHFIPEVIALARPLTHTGEYGIPTMLGSYIADQFLNDNGFPHTRSTVGSHLSPSGERRHQINHFKPGFQHLSSGFLLLKRGRRAVYWQVGIGLNRSKVIERFSYHVK